MKKLKTTSVIVKNAEGKYLGVSRKDNYNSWGFAGGKCEKNESPEDCAKRELFEETGLIALELKLLDVRIYINRYSKPATEDEVYLYEVTKYEGELHTTEYLKEKGEGMIQWVSPVTVCYGAFGDYNKAILKEFYDFKTIWTIQQHVDYEGSDTIGIFTTFEKARTYAEKYVDYCNKDYARYGRTKPRYEEGRDNYWRGDSESIDIQEDFLDAEFEDEGE